MPDLTKLSEVDPWLAVIIILLAVCFVFKDSILKFANRNVDQSLVKKAAKETELLSVQVSDGIINQLREDAIVSRETVKELTRRVNKLEERERHNLVRSSVHEAWDKIAYAKLLALDPAHPAPPPLGSFEELVEADRRTLKNDSVASGGHSH